MMADLRRLAELARAEHYGTITPNQAAALAELRARANQRGQTLSQFVSPLLTIGTAMVAEPVSGLAGIAGTVLPGEPGQGARWVEGTREALTYYPKDEAGQRGVQAVGDFFQPVSNIMDRATRAAGDAGYRVGGPALGAAAATVPTAVSELMGIGKPARAANVMDSISDAARASRRLDELQGFSAGDWAKLDVGPARLEIKDMGDGIKVGSSLIRNQAQRGQGYGIAAYQDLIDRAMNQGKKFIESDETVEVPAARVYEALERRGYNIIRDPTARLVPDSRGEDFWMADGDRSPFRIELGQKAIE